MASEPSLGVEVPALAPPHSGGAHVRRPADERTSVAP